MRDIHHVKQGRNECVIASIAALSGYALSTIKRDVKEYAGMSYTWLYGHGWDVWADAIAHVTEKRLGRRIEMRREEIYPHDRRNDPSFFEFAVEEGKGLAIVSTRLTPPGASHAVAYANGIVYDPREDRPLSVSEWHKTINFSHFLTWEVE